MHHCQTHLCWLTMSGQKKKRMEQNTTPIPRATSTPLLMIRIGLIMHVDGVRTQIAATYLPIRRNILPAPSRGSWTNQKQERWTEMGKYGATSDQKFKTKEGAEGGRIGPGIHPSFERTGQNNPNLAKHVIFTVFHNLVELRDTCILVRDSLLNHVPP